MAQFLSLPRELRDMIYTAILHHRLSPTPPESPLNPTFFTPLPPHPSSSSSSPSSSLATTTITPPRNPNPSSSSSRTFFSTLPRPATCANVLATNRQLNAEMTRVIERARRKKKKEERTFARMDCLVRTGDGGGVVEIWFCWVAVPVVRTGLMGSMGTAAGLKIGLKESAEGVGRWVPVVRRLLLERGGGGSGRRGRRMSGADYGDVAVGRCADGERRIMSTVLEGLRIDVRLTTDDAGAGSEDVTWAICAALKKVLESDSKNAHVSVDMLILNVISPPSRSRTTDIAASPPQIQNTAISAPTPILHASSNQSDGRANQVVDELVAVWNKIWAGEGSKGRYYRSLLEKIQRVRVCLDGVVVRERELGAELERGQMERRRIAMRVGW